MDVQQVRTGRLSLSHSPSFSLSLFLTVAVLYTETPRYTRTSGSTHDEGLPVLSPTLYDSLEANHKIVIEVSYAVTLERRGMTNSRTARDFWTRNYLY